MDCEQAASPDPVDLLRDEGDARGLAVLTLQIESFEQKQGASHFCAAATAGGQRVGFLLELRPSALEPVPVAALELELPRCELLLKTTGEESDRFVAAVAAVYELDLPVGHMPEVLEFEALCLAGDPARPQLGALQLMLAAFSEVEIRLDAALLTRLGQGPLKSVGRFDKALKLQRQRIERLYRGAP